MFSSGTRYKSRFCAARIFEETLRASTYLEQDVIVQGLEAQEVQASEVQAPEVQAPEVQAPEVQALEVQAQEFGQVRKLAEFTYFPRLPPELRIKIWKLLLPPPRIVGMKPPKEGLPGMLHASPESRSVLGYSSKIHNSDFGFILDNDIDILYFDEFSVSDAMSYHHHMQHTLQCQDISFTIFNEIQRVCFSSDEVCTMMYSRFFPCWIFDRLGEVFPQLRELIIIMRPGLATAGYEGLYEVTHVGAGQPWSPDVRKVMRRVKNDFERAQLKDKAVQRVKLKFMRLEKPEN